MPRPKRQLLATAEETLSPPDLLGKGRVIARILRAEGKNLYSAANTSGETLLVELPAKFRSTIWIKKGSFVVINLNAFEERDNKICGEIENVVGDEKAWKKMPYWPVEFSKQREVSDSDEDESTVGKMPPSDESDTEAS